MVFCDTVSVSLCGSEQILNIFHIAICRKELENVASATKGNAHVANPVTWVVTLFWAMFVIAKSVDLGQACIVVMDSFFIVNDSDVGATHGFCTE